MCNPEQCGMGQKEGVLWGDIGIYPAQLWAPPGTVMTKPSLKGKEDVSRGKGEAGRPRRQREYGDGVVRSARVWAQLQCWVHVG